MCGTKKHPSCAGCVPSIQRKRMCGSSLILCESASGEDQDSPSPKILPSVGLCFSSARFLRSGTSRVGGGLPICSRAAAFTALVARKTFFFRLVIGCLQGEILAHCRAMPASAYAIINVCNVRLLEPRAWRRKPVLWKNASFSTNALRRRRQP
jgi:hypothetical protein